MFVERWNKAEVLHGPRPAVPTLITAFFLFHKRTALQSFGYGDGLDEFQTAGQVALRVFGIRAMISITARLSASREILSDAVTLHGIGQQLSHFGPRQQDRLS